MQQHALSIKHAHKHACCKHRANDVDTGQCVWAGLTCGHLGRQAWWWWWWYVCVCVCVCTYIEWLV